jgi:hypothetical protein
VSDDWTIYDDVYNEALHDWLDERIPEPPAPAEYQDLAPPPRAKPVSGDLPGGDGPVRDPIVDRPDP